MSEFDYIKQYYGVPIKKGAKVSCDGKAGIVVGTHGPHVKVRFSETNVKIYHPMDLKWEETP